MSMNNLLPSQTYASLSDDDDNLRDDLALGFDGAEDTLRTCRKWMRAASDLTVSESSDQHSWLSTRTPAEPILYPAWRTRNVSEVVDALSTCHGAASCM